MARRRQVTPDRAWMPFSGGASFIADDTPLLSADVVGLASLQDIDVDEANLTGERSERYLERLLLWVHTTVFLADGGLSGFPEVPVATRIGTMVLERSPETPSEELTLFQEEGMTYLDSWVRIFGEHCAPALQVRTPIFSSGNLGVSDDIALANGKGFLIPSAPPTGYHLYDLTPNARLGEFQDLVLGWGPVMTQGAPGDTHPGASFTVQYYGKALWRKGR